MASKSIALKTLFIVSCLFLQTFSEAQIKEILSKPFYVKWNTYINDSFTEQEHYFMLRLPPAFQYDTSSSWASDLEANLFAVDYDIDPDPEHLGKGVLHDNKADLSVYASLLKKGDLSATDSSVLTGLVIDKKPQTINGFTMLRIRYGLTETMNGHSFSKYCYLYLVPVFPKGDQQYKGVPHIVRLRFSAKPEHPDVFPDHQPEKIMQTIRKY